MSDFMRKHLPSQQWFAHKFEIWYVFLFYKMFLDRTDHFNASEEHMCEEHIAIYDSGYNLNHCWWV